jgi:glycosyltransferase involved in cell wall biosynthesis
MTVTATLLVWGFAHRPRQMVATLAAMAIACELAEEMQRERIEHIHAHFVGHPATAAWVIKRLTGINYSVTAHAYELYQDNEFLKPRIRAAQFVVTISQFNAHFLYRFCAGAAPPISVIRAGIVLEDFPYRERRLPKRGPIHALAVGSLIEHKGHRVLLEALADPQLERVYLTVVGDGEERQNLQAAARAAGLSERVRFVGARREDEVAELMTNCDLFVLPSLIAASGRMEGVPVVLMEAMASGAPVVASRLSGIPELVIDGETGRLAVQGNAASLRAQIAATLADPEAARRMARAARKRVEAEFDVRRSGARLAEWFLAARATARVEKENIHA